MRIARQTFALGVALLALATPRGARAQPPMHGQIPPPPEPYPAPPPSQPGTIGHLAPTYQRVGFYLRGGVGIGDFALGRTLDSTASSPRDTAVSGGAWTTELTIGGAPTPGFVVAGTLVTYSLPRPRWTDGGAVTSLDETFTFLFVGPSVEWYPLRRDGLHVGGAVGFVRAMSGDRWGDASRRFDGRGGGISIDAGYDWPVARLWWIGLGARVTAARIVDHSADAVTSVDSPDRAAAFAFMVSVLYQ